MLDIILRRSGGLPKWTDWGFRPVITQRGTWRCRSEAADIVRTLEPALATRSFGSAAKIIKASERRFVVRAPVAGGQQSWIVKGRRVSGRIRWFAQRKEDGDEAANQLIAQSRGIRTPAVFASGTIRDQQGDAWAIHCAQWLDMTCMRDHFLAEPGADVVESLLDRARGSLRLIFQAGCNHVDFGPHAILISPDSPELDAVIDFEFAVFKRMPCVRTLAAQLGFFGWSIATNRSWASHDQIGAWSERTFAEWKLPYSPECRDIFWSNLRECPSLSQRMAR